MDSINLQSLREIYKEEVSKTVSSFRCRRVRKVRKHAATDAFRSLTNLAVNLGGRRHEWGTSCVAHQGSQETRRIIRLERYAALATDRSRFGDKLTECVEEWILHLLCRRFSSYPGPEFCTCSDLFLFRVSPAFVVPGAGIEGKVQF